MLLTTPLGMSSQGWSSLTVAQRWRVAGFLGALDVHGLFGKPLKRASTVSVRAEIGIVSAGAEVMLGNPRPIVDLLSRIRTQPGAGCGTQLIGDALPGLLVMLRKRLDAPERSYLLPYVESFLASSLEEDTPIVWCRKARGVEFSAKAVGKSLGVRPERVGSLAAALGVGTTGRTTPAGRRMLAVAPSAVEQIRAGLADTLSATAVADRFGLSPGRLVEMIGAGYVERVGRGVSGSSVMELVSRLADGACRESRADITSSVSLTQALRMIVPKAKTAGFVEMLLERVVPLTKQISRPISLRDLFVDPDVVRALLMRERTPSNEMLSIPELAVELRLKQEVVYHLVRTGLVKSVVVASGRRAARFVARTEMKRFEAEIQPLSRLAAGAGVR
ncbi:hypothetical protein, partial [Rhizobacter sp. Root16D2]|uniref:hypothetical protein n=1 Tax=Rhizobacter sp. Root16D2 TaxID=1736479 RepID=UPI00138F7AEE